MADAPLSLPDQVAYYVNLTLAQYKSLPRATQTLAILLKQALGDMLASDLFTAFDLDTAVGAQLDVLGKYIGLSRLIGDPVALPFYGFWDMTVTDPTQQNPNGFTDMTNAGTNAQAIWDQYNFAGNENTALSDTAYAFMLNLKIVLNANDGTLASIQQFLKTFLPGIVELQDNANMTMTYTLSNQIPVSPDVLEAYLPKPMGVGLIFLTLTVAVTPTTLSHTTTGTGFITGTTAAATATPTNGTPPFSYSWEYVSGDTGGIVAFMPTANSTTFSYSKTVGLTDPPVTKNTVFRCVVTDAKGLVAYSNNVAVSITLQPPP